jgi:hypothetical protein
VAGGSVRRTHRSNLTRHPNVGWRPRHSIDQRNSAQGSNESGQLQFDQSVPWPGQTSNTEPTAAVAFIHRAPTWRWALRLIRLACTLPRTQRAPRGADLERFQPLRAARLCATHPMV